MNCVLSYIHVVLLFQSSESTDEHLTPVIEPEGDAAAVMAQHVPILEYDTAFQDDLQQMKDMGLPISFLNSPFDEPEVFCCCCCCCILSPC